MSKRKQARKPGKPGGTSPKAQARKPSLVDEFAGGPVDTPLYRRLQELAENYEGEHIDAENVAPTLWELAEMARANPGVGIPQENKGKPGKPRYKPEPDDTVEAMANLAVALSDLDFQLAIDMVGLTWYGALACVYRQLSDDMPAPKQETGRSVSSPDKLPPGSYWLFGNQGCDDPLPYPVLPEPVHRENIPGLLFMLYEHVHTGPNGDLWAVLAIPPGKRKQGYAYRVYSFEYTPSNP